MGSYQQQHSEAERAADSVALESWAADAEMVGGAAGWTEDSGSKAVMTVEGLVGTVVEPCIRLFATRFAPCICRG